MRKSLPNEELPNASEHIPSAVTSSRTFLVHNTAQTPEANTPVTLPHETMNIAQTLPEECLSHIVRLMLVSWHNQWES